MFQTRIDPPAAHGEYVIRPMTEADLARVLMLEGICHPHPWTPEMFKKELENAVSSIELIWTGKNLVGYGCFWLLCREVHILNLTVSPVFRRRGAGTRLLENILNRPGVKIDRAFLEVRKGNEAAIGLYEAFGFRSAGVRSRYYHDGEDAVLMDWGKSPEGTDYE